MCGSYSADTPPHITAQRSCSTWDKNVEYLDRTIWPNVATWDYKITPPDNWIGILAWTNSVYYLHRTIQYSFLGYFSILSSILSWDNQYTFLGYFSILSWDTSVYFPGTINTLSWDTSVYFWDNQYIYLHRILQYTFLGQSVYLHMG